MIYNHRDVLKIVARTLSCSENELNDESGLSRTLNWDSLNHVIILTSIEDYFEIKIADEKFPVLTSIEKIMKYLDEYELDSCIDNGQCECENPCFEEKRIEFESKDGKKLVGVYCFTNNAPKGFILLTHGIPSEKDEGGFHKNMAAYFAKIGYDSFRFDFRFMGESEAGAESAITIENLITDIESAYQVATSQYVRNNSMQFVVGTSCGGGILLKWINDYNHAESINQVFLCCPVLDYVYECTGVSKSDISTKKNEVLDSLTELGYIKDRDAKYGHSFFLQSLDFDANKEITKYGKHVTIYHGNQDPSVPIKFSKDFAERNLKTVDLVIVDWARHGFGVPFLNKNGERIPDDMRYRIKKRNQSGVICSISCSIKGAEQCQ